MVRVSLPVKSILSGLRIPFDVSYIANGERSLLFRKWTLMTEELHAKLLSEGIQSVFLEGDPNYIKDYLVATGLDDSLSAIFKGALALEEAKLGYHEIERSLVIDKTLIPDGTTVSFSIYEIAEQDIVPVLKASGNKPVKIEPFMNKIKGPLLIRENDIPQYQGYLVEVALQGGPVMKRIQAICLRENAKIVVRKYVTRMSHSFDLSAVLKTSEEIVDLIFTDPRALIDIYLQQSFGVFPYTHAVNVCALSIGLALKLGRDKAFASKLALGALLHDIGKLGLPKEIAIKPGELTSQEYAVFRQHPAEGVRMLSQVKGVSQEALLVILQHHERLNGNGYPLGHKSDKLSHYGRLAALADCFDGLTSSRPHRYALSPAIASLNILREAREYHDFDAAEAKVFASMIHEMTNRPS